MSTIERAHQVGREHFGESYTVEHRAFADGDTRTMVKHSVGWSPTNYVTITIWVGQETVWREYYENDRRLTRETIPLEEWGGDVHRDYQ